MRTVTVYLRGRSAGHERAYVQGMKRRTCFIWLLSSLIFIQTLAVSLHAASYWSYRNNTIFWNGNWLVGKDMGRFVFYTYAFMFEPLEGNQVNLTSMKGYQEILYRQPESDEARLRKIRFEANLGENSYVWIEFGKNREAGKAWRVSRNTDYPDGYYEFDRDGKATLKETFDLVIEGPRNEIECTFEPTFRSY